MIRNLVQKWQGMNTLRCLRLPGWWWSPSRSSSCLDGCRRSSIFGGTTLGRRKHWSTTYSGTCCLRCHWRTRRRNMNLCSCLVEVHSLPSHTKYFLLTGTQSRSNSSMPGTVGSCRELSSRRNGKRYMIQTDRYCWSAGTLDCKQYRWKG